MHKYLLIVLSMINAVLAYLTFNYSPQLTNEEIKITNQKFSVGEDDPYSRFEQEFMMLRDPVTNEIPPNIFKLEQEFAKIFQNEFQMTFKKLVKKMDQML